MQYTEKSINNKEVKNDKQINQTGFGGLETKYNKCIYGKYESYIFGNTNDKVKKKISLR